MYEDTAKMSTQVLHILEMDHTSCFEFMHSQEFKWAQTLLCKIFTVEIRNA